MDNIEIAFELARDAAIMEKNGHHYMAQQVLNAIDTLVGKWKFINNSKCFVWPRQIAKILGVSYIRKIED